MVSNYRIGKIEPEFYFHFQLKKSVLDREWETIKTDLRRLALEAFKEQFANLDVVFEFEVDLQRGTVKCWIRLKKKVLVALFITFTPMIFYDNVRSSIDRVYDDFSIVLTFTKEKVESYMTDKYGIEERIRTERRVGAIGRLDRLIGRYQRGELSHDKYIAEATAILEKINLSSERDEIIPPLRQYMEMRGVNWPKLANVVPGIPYQPQPTKKQPSLPDAVILNDKDKRRRQQGGS